MKMGSRSEDSIESSSISHSRRSIGSILVEANRINSNDAQSIQLFANKKGLRFGEAGVELKLIAPEDIDFALAQQFNYPILTHGNDGCVTDEVVAAYDPQSLVVEDLRTVRSRLVLGWLRRSGGNIIAITSPGRGDGRSWVAANLATVFAQTGERTLLIDANLRQPRQHQLFNIDGSTGLVALLTGRAGREVVKRIHPQLRLFVLPAGPPPPNPQELLTRQIFNLVLAGFAKQFDVLVVDTPAATETADAQIIASQAGAAVMVARQNHTEHASLKLTMDSLLRSGVKVVGSIINDC
jgi:protein-tyrosine kinase